MQSFWAAPVFTLAGVGMQRMLGFTVMIFAADHVVYHAVLLIFD
ncbi:TIGR00366 family protein [Burkholderia sp. SR8]